MRRHNPDVPIEEDLKQLSPGTVREHLAAAGLSDFTVFLGGVPCPTFSTAGKGAGLEDPRGECLGAFVELCADAGADYIVIENVRGLISAKTPTGANVLGGVVDRLEARGYLVSWKLYDAQFFGVPQSRDRVVLIATRAARPVGFLRPTHRAEGCPPAKTLRDAIGDLDAEAPGPCAAYSANRAAVFAQLGPGENWRQLPAEAQRAAMGAGAYAATSGGKTGFLRRLSYDAPSPTLVCSPTQHMTGLCHPTEVRPLSVREYARVQTFPDEYEFCGSMAGRYAQIGNSVPVEFGAAIGRALRGHMLGAAEDLTGGGAARCSRYRTPSYVSG